MDLGLDQKTAIVTGGSKGIGAAIVKILIAEGCVVHFCARDEHGIRKLEDEIRVIYPEATICGTAINVLDSDAVQNWLAGIGSADIAIANASALSSDWDDSINLDLRSTVSFINQVQGHINQGGAITYIGSKASSVGTPGFEAYGATKAAMAHFVKSKSMTAIGQGIRVNMVSPGDTFVAGGFWDNIKSNAPEVFQSTLDANPMGRLAEPIEIARVAVFLSCPASSFVVGANWHVDGGSTQHVRL